MIWFSSGFNFLKKFSQSRDPVYVENHNELLWTEDNITKHDGPV